MFADDFGEISMATAGSLTAVLWLHCLEPLAFLFPLDAGNSIVYPGGISWIKALQPPAVLPSLPAWEGQGFLFLRL